MSDDNIFPHRNGIVIAAVGNALEALVLRAVLESLDASVLLCPVGTPEDFLTILSRADGAPAYLIVSAHGDGNGFVFGEFGPGINVSSIVDGSMPARSIAARMRLPGTTILSTACATGAADFRHAFLCGGAADYIAPSSYPNGADVPLFVHILFHQILRRRACVKDALAEARRYESAFADFTSAAPPNETSPPE